MAKKTVKKVAKKTTKKSVKKDIVTKELIEKLDPHILNKTKDTHVGYIIACVEHNDKKDEIVRSGVAVRQLSNAHVLTLAAQMIKGVIDDGMPKEVITMLLIKMLDE